MDVSLRLAWGCRQDLLPIGDRAPYVSMAKLDVAPRES